MSLTDKVYAGDVGEWQGQEQEAADFINDLNARLLKLVDAEGDDIPRSREEWAVTLATHIFFEELCSNPEMLEWDDAARQSYVERKFN